MRRIGAEAVILQQSKRPDWWSDEQRQALDRALGRYDWTFAEKVAWLAKLEAACQRARFNRYYRLEADLLLRERIAADIQSFEDSIQWAFDDIESMEREVARLKLLIAPPTRPPTAA